MAPRDEAMLVHMLRTAHRRTTARSPCATRAARASASPLPERRRQALEIGTGEILREGVARRAARLRHAASARRSRPPTCCAERGIDVTVADARFAKPLDAALLRPARRRARAARHGRGGRPRRRLRLRGVGDAVTTPARAVPRILRVGLPDRYVTHGKPALLHAEVGFTGERDRRAHRGRDREPDVGPPSRARETRPPSPDK